MAFNPNWESPTFHRFGNYPFVRGRALCCSSWRLRVYEIVTVIPANAVYCENCRMAEWREQQYAKSKAA